MTAVFVRREWRIVQGTTWEERYRVVPPLGEAAPVLTDGYRVQARARADFDTDTLWHEWDSDDAGDAVTFPEADVFALHLDPSDSAAWQWSDTPATQPGDYDLAVYDVRLTDPDGQVTELDAGIIKLERR